ncbi:diacylglycerol kinase family protein [Fictibacillus sp. Mic-4]|uniref:diacylglycerol kinase family protein n=1 Tax=Fictibacillus sp. Mic-4 TaxID=3132826 RepID=UPI003CE92C03
MKFSFAKFLKSFGFAFEGIVYAYKNEQNFRIHLGAATITILFAFWLDFSSIRMLLLLIVIGVVLALELVNTAIERVVDLVAKHHHPLAKEAKDAASGAVLVFSIIAVIIGVLLFIEPLINRMK